MAVVRIEVTSAPAGPTLLAPEYLFMRADDGKLYRVKVERVTNE